MDWHQRRSLLRTDYFPNSRSHGQYDLTARYWCRRYCYVARNHSSCDLRGQGRSQTYSGRWRHRYGHLPYHYCGHRRNLRRPLGGEWICRLGCRRDGLALRCPLRILLGTLRLDRHCGNLANLSTTVWYRYWRFVQLDEQRKSSSVTAKNESCTDITSSLSWDKSRHL